MLRTRNRPLPAGRIQPNAAWAFGVTIGLAGVAYLFYAVNPLTAALGLVTQLTYVFLYTPLKRMTSLNTVVGAVPGAIPPLTEDHPIFRLVGAGRGGGNAPGARDKHAILDK